MHMLGVTKLPIFIGNLWRFKANHLTIPNSSRIPSRHRTGEYAAALRVKFHVKKIMWIQYVEGNNVDSIF